MNSLADTEIIEFLATTGGRWVRIGEVSSATGITDPEDFRTAIADLFQSGLISAEPDPFPWRVTPAEKALAPTIGDEPRHIISWIG